MQSYTPILPSHTTIEINESTEGETIETRVERIMNNKEPIEDGAPAIYTPRKDGVLPETNIRTDRFELALDATDAIYKQKIAKREAFQKKLDEDNANEINSQQPPTKPNPTGPETK